jgi:hypothetical protein
MSFFRFIPGRFPLAFHPPGMTAVLGEQYSYEALII